MHNLYHLELVSLSNWALYYHRHQCRPHIGNQQMRHNIGLRAFEVSAGRKANTGSMQHLAGKPILQSVPAIIGLAMLAFLDLAVRKALPCLL